VDLKNSLATVALLIAIWSWADPASADEKALFSAATGLYQGEQTSASDIQVIRDLLDRIVAEFPSSDLAVSILMQETVDGIDIAGVDARLAALRKSERVNAPPPETAAASETILQQDASAAASPLPVGSFAPATEAPVPQADDILTAPSPAAPAAGNTTASANVPAPPASDPWNDLLGQATLLYSKADNFDQGGRTFALLEVRRLLDQIVDDYPDSDIAVRIMLQETVDGIDVAALTLQLARRPDSSVAVVDTPPGDASNSATALSEQPLMEFSPATEQSENTLSFDKAAVRDLQSRLLALGFDPNGIDGALGRGTRSAVSAWQNSAGVPATGFLDDPQLQALKTVSQVALELWLADPDNQRLYEPPPPIKLTSSNVSGSWTYTARCGRKSRYPGQTFTGALQIRYSGSTTFDGAARNAQGFNGTVRGQIKGRTITGRVNWGLLVGSQTFSGKFAEQSMVINARDSDGCSITARKR
jgi:peptidoglycan hydrolase-like protein with peptidoglycan-binding domain